MIRLTTSADIPQLKEIWKNTFGDSDSFVNWLFSQRFSPELSACAREDGKIVSCMHGCLLPINLGATVVPAVLISGVATLPEYRRKGLMGKVFRYLIHHLHSLDIPMVFYRPENPDVYRFLGHVHISQAIDAQNALAEKTTCGNIKNVDISRVLPLLYDCYQSFSRRYSMTVNRGDYFFTKMNEYIYCNLNCRAVYSKGKIQAYVIYSRENGKLLCDETVGDPDMLYKLLSSMEKPFSAKLPPDFPYGGLSGNAMLKDDLMGGIVSISALLKAYNSSCPYIIEVSDSVFPETCGVYDFSGNKTKKPADIKLSAGELLQLLAGYRVPSEFSDYFKMRKCYTTDPY